MHTDLQYDKEVFQTILKASKKLSDHVGATMGPAGANAIIRKSGFETLVTQDGVTVARAIKLADPAEDSVVDIIRGAASLLEQEVGDGTTTVTVLTHAILEEANKLFIMGWTKQEIIRSIDSLVPDVLQAIDNAKLDTTHENLIKVATISGKEASIGQTVADTIWELGSTATVMTEESATGEDKVETVNGYEVGFGWVSHYMAPEREVTKGDPLVVVCDMNIRDKQDILPILSAVNKAQRPLVLFARQISGDALSLLVINKIKNVVDSVAIEIVDGELAAGDILQDIARVVGAEVLGRSNGKPVDSFTLDNAGTVSTAIIGKDKSTLVGFGGVQEDISGYIQVLKDAKTKDKLERKALDTRIASLEAKVATIYVGGATASERQERLFRFDDAIGAAKTALKDGIVEGAGSVFKRFADTYTGKDLSALTNALRAPQERILSNGAEYLFDYTTAGVYDPAGTLKACLQTAVSTAKLLINGGSIITEVKDDVTRNQ